MLGVRPADHSDVHTIAQVFVESWRTAYAGLLPDEVLLGLSPDRQEGYWRKTMDRLGGLNIVEVAESDEEVVGFINAGRARSWPLKFRGEIYTLYQLPDFQGHGLGRMLLAETFRHMVKQDISSAIVWVLGQNHARYFYEAMGGKLVGERHEYRWNTHLHEVAYGWRDVRDVLVPGGPLALDL
ncbi:MAG: GNAT family N-acetyltransferase [Alphaproteobacteria bacterium]